ncbi:UNVERIFIED_CONTAM: hypothetical protein Sradi_4580400 [Sesamum radiatum]|uniref:Uncharacterized protein n=1 Tax=Sesamum radiatum TaxID=300843 RepID=A0AAW2NB09_SESRA
MSSDVGLHLNPLYPIGSPKSGNLGLLVWNGSSGVAGSMMLLKARKIMHAPITQVVYYPLPTLKEQLKE